jgi:hypothetical protein
MLRMRVVVSLLSALMLFGCSTEGTPGPVGPQGEVGPAGSMGAPGPVGPQGNVGPVGPVGPQGALGPAGQVLVVDGGVVTGPPGASVVVTPITAGGATCPAGGQRLTQLSDGGISSVCNGAPGAAGATGPAGPAGPVGASLTATALPMLSPQCPTGGVLVGLADGGTLPVCNGAIGSTGATGAIGAIGATGAIGPIGPTGPAGPVGPAGSPGATGATGAPGAAGAPGAIGPAGPPGAPGPALYLDGGLAFPNETPSFAGFTAATYTGNLGGHVGANAKCNAEFAGSVYCTLSDFDRSNHTAAPSAVGAWIDSDRSSTGQRAQNSCSTGGASWSLGTSGDTGTNLNTLGTFTSQTSCNQVKPLACCRVPSAVIFRGFTAAIFTGSLGGHVGANAKCVTEFPGSFFCTLSDFDKANTLAPPPSSGAWIDSNRAASGSRAQNSCSTGGASWNLGTAGDTGTNLNALGTFNSQTSCNAIKPLACCQNR